MFFSATLDTIVPMKKRQKVPVLLLLAMATVMPWTVSAMSITLGIPEKYADVQAGQSL
jgi:hypothetical protein